jgi:L-2,4-diaminobutyrate transaminase
MKQFMSGATYQGHPLCSAAGLANLEIIEREELVGRCAELGPYMQEGLRSLLSHAIVGDVRGIGLVAGIEYVQDKETKEWFSPAVGAAGKVFAEAFRRGVFVRLLGGGNVHASRRHSSLPGRSTPSCACSTGRSAVVEKELGY